ncbi:MAG: hypothetical protein ACYDEA_01210 [Candidatus Dormibacteria bacterium]
MSAFGSVPGLTILTMALVLLLGGTFLTTAVFVSFSSAAQRSWKVVVIPVAFMFVLTMGLALISAIAENQFATRITGG